MDAVMSFSLLLNSYLNLSGPDSGVNEGVLCIPQNSSITGAKPSNCSISYLGHTLWGILPIWRKAVDVFYCHSWLGFWGFYYNSNDYIDASIIEIMKDSN